MFSGKLDSNCAVYSLVSGLISGSKISVSEKNRVRIYSAFVCVNDLKYLLNY